MTNKKSNGRPRLKKGLRNKLRNERKGLKQPKFVTNQPRSKKPRDLTAIRSMRENLSATLDKECPALFDSIRRLSLEDLITFLMLEKIGYNPNDYNEARDTDYQPTVEYLVQLRMREPSCAGDSLTENFPAFMAAFEKGKQLQLVSVMWAFGPSLDESGNLVAKDDREEMADEIIGKLRGHQLVERNPSYHHFGWDLLKGLFTNFDAQLSSIVGFTIADVEAFEKGVGQAMTESRDRVYDLAKKVAAEKEEPLIRRISDLSEEELQGHDRSQLEDAARGAIGTQSFMQAILENGCPFKFSVEQLVRISGLSVEKVEKLLDFFSIGGGDVPETFTAHSPDGPLRTRPIVKLDETFYVMPAPYLFTWCVQERLEAAIAAAATVPIHRRLRDRYEAHRGAFAESSTLEWLAQALPGAAVYRGLTYTTEDESGKRGWELDGLIVYDCHAFLVEVKAGGLNNPARQGKFIRLAERVSALIAEAHDQVGRAIEFVRDSDKPVFSCDGQEVVIDKSRIYSLIPITVSLEGLGSIAASYNNLIQSGFVKSEVVPWAVPYFDLRIICDLVEAPPVLIAYIHERLRLADNKVIQANDEVSWFGWFLNSGLRFTNPEFAKADLVTLASATGDIDNFYLHQMGDRTIETEKPRLKAPQTFIDIFNELCNLPDHGASMIASRFLCCTNEGRAEIPKALEQIRSRTQRDGAMHDFSDFFRDGGLSVISCTCNSFERARSMVVGYASDKKYQGRRPWWIFFISVADTQKLVAHAGYLSYPFKSDERAEQRVRKLPSAIFKIPDPE